MTSSQSSSASSAHAALGHDGHRDTQSRPQLDTLIAHLLAAKRSLSSINHVWRANEIVTSSRSALEESVVLSARTGFLRRGLNHQLRLLYSVRSEVEEISYRGREDFSASLRRLDTADTRLKQTLDLLRETMVDSSFRPQGEDPKSLHDFVDERGVEELHTAMKESIDRTNTARTELDTSNREFDDELDSIKNALHHYRTATKLASSRASASSSASASASSSASDSGLLTLSSMPGMLQALEMHAQEMASLLESLVRHFDLCVTAVKHTEGGGAAAQSITGDIPAGAGAMPNIEEEIHANLNAPLDPLTGSEYQEMVSVLVKDAVEAEDVVVEIQDRISEMESTFEQMLSQRDALQSVSRATAEVYRHLSTLASTRLPRYISQAHNFTRVWHEEHDRINNGLAELSDLHSLYDGFLNAYDSLILEVARRKHIRHRVEKVLRETSHKLDQLYEEDVTAREAFRVDQGDFLPSDIWPGVGRAPMQVQFLRLSGGHLESTLAEGQEPEQPDTGDYETDLKKAAQEEEGELIPNLSKHVVEQAYARLKARTRGIA
jgi:autophagy-related protein 17